MDVSLAEWGPILALVPITFLGSVLYGITGFGSALVTIPIASHFLPLPFTLATFALIDLANALRVGFENPKHVVKREWARLATGIPFGILVGVTALVNLPRKAGMVALGTFVAGYAIYSLAKRGAGKTVAPAWAWVAGVSGGLTGTLFGAGGPPYAIYLSHRPLDKEQYRATLTMTSVVSIGLRALAFLITGLLLNWKVWVAAALAIPAAMAGLAVARKAFTRVSREGLMRLVAIVLLATGASLVARGVA